MAVEVSGPAVDNRKLGDLLRAIFSPAYNYAEGPIKNVSGAAVAIADPLGHPVKLVGTDWVLVAAADIANVGGLLVYDKPIPSIADDGFTAKRHLILVRGPAVIHEDGLRAADYADAAINQANFKTALAALDIVTIEGPDPTTQTSTQTT